jgi:signal transduction histidine kinase
MVCHEPFWQSQRTLTPSKGRGFLLRIKIEDLPSIHIHKTLLIQIFSNLIGNAIQYAGSQGSPIEVGGNRSGEWVRFYVRDHGPGIPKEEINNIFDLFSRGSTGSRIKGTGVGLATVKKIARHYEGKVWVEETPGGGATFWIEFRDTPD